ncbi:MAG: hypothetical protein IPI57_13690 [Candidatus Competibacteraceae bacterium]|nr:hypothetical protein [Candidatus Competibacteraceae bacterium]
MASRARKNPSAPIPESWQPGAQAFAILESNGIPKAFAETCIDEFVLYWTERGDARPGWDASFVNSVKRDWTRRPIQAPLPGGGRTPAAGSVRHERLAAKNGSALSEWLGLSLDPASISPLWRSPMQQHDKPAFGLLVTGYLQEIYEKSVSPALLTVWFETLKGYEIGDIEAGFARYVAHPEDCRFPPKPGDIIRHLPAPKPEDDGRPSADEAWGLLLRVARDEAETGALSEEIREGWQACGAILDAGDEVGARRCFIDAYNRRVQLARERHEPARWTVTLGTDRQLREERIGEAVKLGRIGHDHAISLLPGPSATSIEQVAGLLEGPDATPDQQRVSRQLRGLLEIIRAGGSDAEDRRREEREARQARESAEREKALAALESRGIKPGSAGTDEAAA